MDTPLVEPKSLIRALATVVLGLVLLSVLLLLGGRGGLGQGGQSEGPFLLCPVANGVVKDNFGALRRGHTHQGDDILADWGTPVLAPFWGNVYDSQTAGGMIVTLERSDGSFIVGKHQSFSTVERPVQTGDVIGFVGRLKNARSFPHLHFEWHPGGGPAVDPFPYLSEVCPNTWVDGPWLLQEPLGSPPDGSTRPRTEPRSG